MKDEDRSVWEEMSNEDKKRYETELKIFKQANRMANVKRPRKDPNAPKR